MADDILRELEDDIRADRAKELWKEYGSWIIAISVAVVLGTSAGVYYRHHKSTEQMTRTTALYNAVQAENAEAFDKVRSEAKGTPQAALAELRKAHLLNEQGSKVGAMKAYEMIAGNGEYPLAMRNLAKVQMLHIAVQSGENYSANHTIKEGEPFYYSYREAEGWWMLSTGKRDEAIARFAALAQDENAPAEMRHRLLNVRDYLGYTAPSMEKEPVATQPQPAEQEPTE